MKRKTVTQLLSTLLLVVVFFGSHQTEAKAAEYIPPTNLVTTEGTTVNLPDKVFFSKNDDQEYGEISVNWNPVSATIFNQVGSHEVKGRAENNQEVTGFIHVYSKNKPVTISAIGDSLTEGAGLNKAQAYPAQLNNRLGDNYKVTNFGHSGATLSSGAAMSYKNQNEYKESIKTSFDVAIIQLGSNDSWNDYWWNYGMNQRFKNEYVAFIKEYKALNPNAVIYVCLPSTMAKAPSQTSNLQVVLPQIVRAAREANVNVSIINNHTISKGLPDTGYYLSDGLHPTAKGMSISTNNIYAALRGKTEKKLAGKVSAKDFDQNQRLVNEQDKTSGEFYLDGIANGDWVAFKEVDFSQNKGEIQLTTMGYDANLVGNVQVEVRLDQLDGRLIGEGFIRKNTSWESSKFYNETVSGVHDVYLKFKHPSRNAFDYLFKLKEIDFSVQTTSNNVLRNGDFEEGLNYWLGDNTSDYGVDGNQPYQGKGKLWLYSNNKLDRKATQKVTGLKDGIYTVTAMAKRTTAAGTARMQLMTDGKITTLPIGVSFDYQPISQVVNVKNGQLDISFGYKSTAGESGLVIDNVALTAGGQLPAENYLEDGDFEADKSKWQAVGTGDSGIDTNDAYSGQKLWLYSNSAYDRTVYQNVSNLADGVYTVKAMVKRTTAAGTARMETTTVGEETVVKPIKVSQNYTELSQVVEVKQGQLKIAFRYKNTDYAPGGLVVDNVVLLKEGVLPPKNYLKDGDFEADQSKWQAVGSGNSGVDTNDAYSGQKLWIYNNGAFDRTVYQEITDLEDGIYTIKGMAKRTTPAGIARLEATTTAGMTTKAINVRMNYEAFEHVVEVKNGQLKLAFRYLLEGGGAGGLVVDNVELTKGGTLPPKNYLINGDFEEDLKGWTYEGNALGVDTNDAYEGKKLWFYNNYGYKAKVYQKLENLPNGSYEVSAMVKLAQPMAKSAMEIETTQLKPTVNIPATNKYEKISYTIDITDGRLQVGFSGEDTGGRGFQVDNVSVVKVQ